MINILLIVTAVLTTILGLVTFFSGPKKSVNRFATFFVASSFIWITTNYLTNISSQEETALLFARSALAGAALIPYTFLLFIISYTKEVTRAKAVKYALLPLVILLLSPTPLNVASTAAFGRDIVVGPAYILVLVEFIVYFWLGFHLLFSAKKGTTNQQKRKQIDYILVGCLIALVPALATNAVLPATGNGDIASLGPAFTLSMVLGVSIAILRYGLLDFRLIVVRSIAYLGSILLLVIVFAGLAIPLTSLLLPEGLSQNQQIVVYTIVAVFLALVLQPMQVFFNRVTNRFFYKDAYETQVVLDQVSGTIVGNIDPAKIQKGALAALSDAIKPTYMAFYLHEGGALHKGVGIGDHSRSKEYGEDIRVVFSKTGKHILLYDELDDHHADINELLRDNDISIVSPLVTKDSVIGYIVCGAKKSGNTYNSQDIGLLNIAANELAVALQNAQRFEEIQAFNITLQEKVNEATRELKSTNKKLVALDEAKDEFISMASHQLRTPLTSIKGYLSMILDGDMGKLNKNQTQALKEAFGSSQRMVFLISDFLNVSRIKTGKFVIEPKEIDLAEMVGEELKQLTEMADSRDITLKYDQPEQFPLVKLDDNKIRQVMMNMVDNAIYYTPAGGTVTIQLMVDGKDVVFKVVDTGIGVPRSEQHKLFTKFFRAGNAKVARPDGTGLGLFMAQKIIVAQNGSIIFESEEGKGSTFGFRFPLKSIKA